MTFAARFFFVSGFEKIGIYGVRNTDYCLSCQQGTLFGLSFQPLAASDESDRGFFIELLLLMKDTV